MSARGARFEAMTLNSPTYWTGVPCKNNHTEKRDTRSGVCLECRRENERKRYAADPKKQIEKKQSFYKLHAEKIKQNRRSKYCASPEKEREASKERSALWRLNNPEKLKAQKHIKQAYKQRNPHKVIAATAKRRAAKKHRTPHWLTNEDHWMIEQIYDLAALRTKVTGVSWHVDHIYPIQGDFVSGLHVPGNLRVVPWFENLSKGNKFPADVVAALGNGSTKAGSDKLYDMMHSIRAYHRSAKPKDLPPPAKKSPLDYLKGKKSTKARR